MWEAELVRPTSALDTALLAEVAAKSDLVWVKTELGQGALWHVWLDGQVAVVVGGTEQADPQLVDKAPLTLIFRSKDKGQRVLTVSATANQIVPGSPMWEDVTSALVPKRLNAVLSEGETLDQQWAASSSVWLLEPTGSVLEGPENYLADSHRAEPLPTPATTVTHHPFHFGKATKKRRR